MPSVSESVDQQSAMAASLKSGLNVLSQDQEITFVRYVKVVLPLDGFVFWVRAGLLAPSAIFNGSQFNTAQFNAPQVSDAPLSVTVKGSLHYSINQRQGEEENLAVNRVIFTAETEIQDLNEVSPTVLYLGEFQGIRFAFSDRGKFYKAADLFHYSGDAVYPVMQSVIIDSLGDIDFRNVVVSNSLPLWLTLTRFCPVYPSFAIPDNLPPPYIAVHVVPEATRALQALPLIDDTGAHWQLVTDRVRVTVYGLRNFSVMDWLDYALEYLENGGTMGLMNSPVPRDEKRSQNEMSTLAIKKVIDFDVSYYQSRVRDVARRYILSCVPNLIVA